MYAGDPVFEHHQLVNLSELLEHRTQIVLVEVAWYLSDEQLDGVRVLVSERRGGGGRCRGRRRVVGDGSGQLLGLVMTGGDRRALLDVQHVERLVRSVGHRWNEISARANGHRAAAAAVRACGSHGSSDK